jgi:hypothetical protein
MTVLLITNPLAPSDPHIGRTAQLTSRRCILNVVLIQQISVLNILNVLHNLHLFHNSTSFSSCIIHILNTGCAKIKKKALAPKG